MSGDMWLDFADSALSAWAGWGGAAVFAAGLWLLWRSHADLGRNWSPSLLYMGRTGRVLPRVKKPASLFLVCLVLAFMVVTPSARAERIDGPANVRESPNGQVLFSLNHDVEVTCSDLKSDNWYLIGVVAKLGKEAILENFTIKPGQVLFDQDGKEIGKTLAPVSTSMYSEEDGYYYYELVAYTYKDNIQENSIIEGCLEEIINQKNGPLTLSAMQAHIREFGYDFWMGQGDFKSYIYYETWAEDPSPRERIILIFHKQNLIALLFSKELAIPYPSRTFERSARITYIEPLPEDVKTGLEAYYYNILRNSD